MNNKELILSKINELRFTNKHGDEFEQGFNNALDCISNFLNSIPAEPPSGDLEKVATALTNEIVGELNVGDYTDHSGHNAHWHSFKEGVIAGANWQKEQMMKSAIDATCVILPPPDLFKVLICHEVTDKLADKQKIKILIVKEDKQ